MSAAQLDRADGRQQDLGARGRSLRLSVARLVGHRYALAGTMTMLVAAAGTVLTR